MRFFDGEAGTVEPFFAPPFTLSWQSSRIFLVLASLGQCAELFGLDIKSILAERRYGASGSVDKP